MVSAPALVSQSQGKKRETRLNIFCTVEPRNADAKKRLPRNVFPSLLPSLPLFVLLSRSKDAMKTKFTKPRWNIFSSFRRCSIGRGRSKITSFPFLSMRMKIIALDRSSIFTGSCHIFRKLFRSIYSKLLLSSWMWGSNNTKNKILQGKYFL